MAFISKKGRIKIMKGLMKRITDENVGKMSGHLWMAALEAFQNEKYLESAVIYFQMLDATLRYTIFILGKNKGLRSGVITRLAEHEDRFVRLVNYFDLLKPDNGLSSRLLDINKRRNKIIHRLLFSFESLDSLRKELKNFCKEGFELALKLADLTPEIR
jgi:hypothetical protein